MDNYKVGKQIAMRRKECGYTQESLAEKLNVTSQAVSKWENGRALPETCILPDLAQALGTSIDSILVQNEIQILSAYYGDGIESYNVTDRLSRLIQKGHLEIEINSFILACHMEHNRPKYLIVKFETEEGVFYTFAKEQECMIITNKTKVSIIYLMYQLCRNLGKEMNVRGQQH